jgi:hypothetical protein
MHLGDTITDRGRSSHLSLLADLERPVGPLVLTSYQRPRIPGSYQPARN